MRATSPKDELEHFGDFVSIPLPRHPIGTRLDPSKLQAHDRAYYYRLVLRGILKTLREVLARLNRQGFSMPEQGKRLLPFHKARVREMLNLVSRADSVEIAGHAPLGMHVSNQPAHQCYLRNGQCHSGVGYSCYLLFRKEVDGQKLVYLHPHPVIREEYIKNILAEVPADA